MPVQTVTGLPSWGRGELPAGAVSGGSSGPPLTRTRESHEGRPGLPPTPKGLNVTRAGVIAVG